MGDLDLRFNVPYWVVIVSFLVLCVVDVVVLSTKRNVLSLKNTLIWSLLLEYVFLVLCSTVLCRDARLEYDYELTPFWSYPAYVNGRKDLLKEVLLNIVLFVPIGFLLSGVMKGKRWLKVIVLSLTFSVCIELMQLVFKRGLCEVDDLIHNTLGAMIGFGCYWICEKITKTITKTKT